MLHVFMLHCKTFSSIKLFLKNLALYIWSTITVIKTKARRQEGVGLSVFTETPPFHLYKISAPLAIHFECPTFCNSSTSYSLAATENHHHPWLWNTFCYWRPPYESRTCMHLRHCNKSHLAMNVFVATWSAISGAQKIVLLVSLCQQNTKCRTLNNSFS